MKYLMLAAVLLGVACVAHGQERVGASAAVDPAKSPMAQTLLAKAKELGKTEDATITEFIVNGSVRYGLYTAHLLVDGKKCQITATGQTPPTYVNGEDGCVLCC